ncbi:amidohydrolase [Pleionea sp. CnH1-48]|uniref:amidohydrolase n=1 Tax=Pleionea sp. CnH1-48 TaxID=2954494 RepID=UPI0020980722|nr:amidohydrolase [Pleionea sp. CnH1-48]MCO7224704.1 amidohydrolase [Pleionea sp. CnH1-48]
MKTFSLFALLVVLTSSAAAVESRPSIEDAADKVESKVIQWRRHIHEHPELSNREFKTAELVAKHLKALGLEVTTKVAHTGVVGILKGKGDGPVVALRADMDALPVTERVDLPFASKVKTQYNDQEVGVMHACGHDTHVAMLMGVAEVLSKHRDAFSGTIKFIFQPAEEGAPKGEEGGAELMVREGVLSNPDVDVVFGLHISSRMKVGSIGYRKGGLMAAVDNFKVTIHGKQVHGSTPWNGIDPIVTAAQMINNIQTIVSRQLPLTKNAAVITVGSIHGGVRSNIIPEQVEMLGTIRTLDEGMRQQLHKNLRDVVKHSAASMGAKATLELPYTTAYPVTYNNPELVTKMLPSLEAVLGASNVLEMNAITGAEDFSFYAEKVPSFFFFLGGRKASMKPSEAPAHHTPDFFIDESGMKAGVKVMSQLALDYLAMHQE